MASYANCDQQLTSNLVHFSRKLTNIVFSVFNFKKVKNNKCCFIIAGSLAEEEEVLQWLITQKTEDRIELITRVMLENMVEDTQYLAVYFCKFVKTLNVNYFVRIYICVNIFL